MATTRPFPLYHFVMRSLALTFLLLCAATALSAQIIDTEVWLGSLDMSGGKFTVSGFINISNHPGYDNQPTFYPDGTRLVLDRKSVV